jgi:hypothetical protein
LLGGCVAPQEDAIEGAKGRRVGILSHFVNIALGSLNWIAKGFFVVKNGALSLPTTTGRGTRRHLKYRPSTRFHVPITHSLPSALAGCVPAFGGMLIYMGGFRDSRPST